MTEQLYLRRPSWTGIELRFSFFMHIRKPQNRWTHLPMSVEISLLYILVLYKRLSPKIEFAFQRRGMERWCISTSAHTVFKWRNPATDRPQCKHWKDWQGNPAVAPTECCPEIWLVRSAMQMELGFGAQDWVNAQKGMEERNRGGGGSGSLHTCKWDGKTCLRSLAGDAAEIEPFRPPPPLLCTLSPISLLYKIASDKKRDGISFALGMRICSASKERFFSFCLPYDVRTLAGVQYCIKPA